VQRLSLSYHDSKGSTDSTYRIQWDAQSIQYVMIDGFVPFITSGCTLALMLYVTVRLDPPLAMVGLAISPVLLVLMRIYRRRLRGQHVLSGGLPLGGLRIVMAYLSLPYELLETSSKRSASLRPHLASRERAAPLLHPPPDVSERPNTRRLVRATRGLAFRHVSF